MQDFRNLKVWQQAHKVTLGMYAITKAFPKEEMFGLMSQIRRSAASIGANIAEGCGRQGDGEFGRFLHIAMGSACELEYHLLLARDLDFISATEYQRSNAELIGLKRMLASLMQKVVVR